MDSIRSKLTGVLMQIPGKKPHLVQLAKMRRLPVTVKKSKSVFKTHGVIVSWNKNETARGLSRYASQ